jgi:hypothetical protein
MFVVSLWLVHWHTRHAMRGTSPFSASEMSAMFEVRNTVHGDQQQARISMLVLSVKT